MDRNTIQHITTHRSLSDAIQKQRKRLRWALQFSVRKMNCLLKTHYAEGLQKAFSLRLLSQLDEALGSSKVYFSSWATGSIAALFTLTSCSTYVHILWRVLCHITVQVNSHSGLVSKETIYTNNIQRAPSCGGEFSSAQKLKTTDLPNKA